jgi:hypothetical protein
MAPRIPPRKVTYFEPVPPRLARNTTLDVGRRFRCTIESGWPGSLARPACLETYDVTDH